MVAEVNPERVPFSTSVSVLGKIAIANQLQSQILLEDLQRRVRNRDRAASPQENRWSHC